MDPQSGFNSETKTFESLRPHNPLPPLSHPLSITSYILSQLLPPPAAAAAAASQQPPLPSNPALVDSSTSTSTSFPHLLSQIHSLSSSLQSHFHLSKSHVAFILSPPTLSIPVLYLSLLSLGVVISPSNPISSPSEIAHQIALAKPAIIFTTTSTSPSLPSQYIRNVNIPNILLDSDFFKSFLTGAPAAARGPVSADRVRQSDTAAILFSSGTTSRIKGVSLTHRNFIALTAGYCSEGSIHQIDYTPVVLMTVPLFHVFGLTMLMRNLAMGTTSVLMERFEFGKMLKTVERYKVTNMPVSPPLVVALAKVKEVEKFDLSSLRIIGCGGAPLGKEVAEKFKERFPNVDIVQGYGLTESTGGITSMVDVEETKVYGSVGRIASDTEARIVDRSTGEALGPDKEGELWLRGPTIMTGYVGDEQATASTLTSDGWLKTGDLCYFDRNGFLFIVDRLKELIKYKAYQVPPAELEHILQSNPEIADAAVVPYPDDEAGEIPMAFVVKQPGSNLTEQKVMDFVAKQVAPYKKIRRVAFVISIPKSAAGKILRRELVDLARSDPASKL